MEKITADGHDNRMGDDKDPAGFVYFSDGKRLVFTSQHGLTYASGGWGVITPDHIKAASDYLKRVFPDHAASWDKTLIKDGI